jgi:cell division protein FtsB
MKTLIIVGLFAVLAGLQYALWFGEGNLADAWKLSDALAAQRAENAHLESRNQTLAAEVRDLKRGHAAIEEHARVDLGMIKQGETFYQIVEPASNQPLASGN